MDLDRALSNPHRTGPVKRADAPYWFGDVNRLPSEKDIDNHEAYVEEYSYCYPHTSQRCKIKTVQMTLDEDLEGSVHRVVKKIHIQTVAKGKIEWRMATHSDGKMDHVANAIGFVLDLW